MSDVVMPNNLVLYGYSIGIDYRTEVIATHGGHEQRNESWDGPLHRFRISVGAMVDSERSEFMSFYRARRGRLDSFIWEDVPTGQTYRVRFEDDRLDISTEHFEGHYSDVNIVEVRDGH